MFQSETFHHELFIYFLERFNFDLLLMNRRLKIEIGRTLSFDHNWLFPSQLFISGRGLVFEQSESASKKDRARLHIGSLREKVSEVGPTLSEFIFHRLRQRNTNSAIDHDQVLLLEVPLQVNEREFL